ncbi:ADP-ribosylglycohydrolase [Paenibacillus rhizosphaerae]|uniref:ADP-ribosylglycohydrolase n=1 Tax=Paenibacillus rhizosphaerae TaxID=297318 RepID=A0A839TFT8_9BACL|nr:ADP-ribosylglycohydrolase family protein [Paenibacillus rhizosphaerae]MBB3125414.1 ADP-ribosylglycohydrolase [Paenibacillus rhizosphaerae]
MAGWDCLYHLIKEEVVQRKEEGCNTEGFEEKLETAGNDRQKWMAIYEELIHLPISPDFPFKEPSGLEEIRLERPDGPRVLQTKHSEKVWRDKFYGSWLGRSVGCALGKPVEQKEYMAGSFGNPGWKNVMLWFQGADAWPITSYVPAYSRAQKEVGLTVGNLSTKSLRENICFMESDDDIRYTVLGLMMLEEKGLEWDSWDVGMLWHRILSYHQVCTAETQAYLNFAQVTSHAKNLLEKERSPEWEMQKDWVRTYLNPYREWIGAQIRADGLAYGAAGKPELAAELAWRDASFSHVKNGIYGEMFIAAMIAAAFTESDPERIVEIGLSEIPANSRLAKDVKEAIAIARSAQDQVELVDRVWETFKHYNPVHTNNNAALVSASLIFGQGDFERAVTTSVLGGWDTDCNGATVGSIMGAMVGAEGIPASWSEPLNDTLYAEVIGFHPISISECSSRSYEVFKKLNPDD